MKTRTYINPCVPYMPLFFASVSTPTIKSSRKTTTQTLYALIVLAFAPSLLLLLAFALFALLIFNGVHQDYCVSA
jgi:hypothetical protein